MGVERNVTLPAGQVIDWSAAASRLAGRGRAVRLMMIDGLPAFPDEDPPADWRELRVGTPAGMVTLRRTADGISLVVWGNADAALQGDVEALAAALAG